MSAKTGSYPVGLMRGGSAPAIPESAWGRVIPVWKIPAGHFLEVQGVAG